MITPKKIEQIILGKFPQAKVKISEHGDSTVGGKRYVIETVILGEAIAFAMGENLLFYINKVPRNILQFLPLGATNTVKAFVELCLTEIQDHLKKKDIPKVQGWARKYLGQEESYNSEKDKLTLNYDKFHIIISSTSFFLIQNKDNRTIKYFDLRKETDLEKVFSGLGSVVEAIRQGTI